MVLENGKMANSEQQARAGGESNPGHYWHHQLPTVRRRTDGAARGNKKSRQLGHPHSLQLAIRVWVCGPDDMPIERADGRRRIAPRSALRGAAPPAPRRPSRPHDRAERPMVYPARSGLARVESAPARANRRCRLLCWPSRCLQPRDLRSRPIWHLNHLGPPRLDPVARAFLFSTRVRCQPARPAEQPGATAARRRRPQDTTRGPPSPLGT